MTADDSERLPDVDGVHAVDRVFEGANDEAVEGGTPPCEGADDAEIVLSEAELRSCFAHALLDVYGKQFGKRIGPIKAGLSSSDAKDREWAGLSLLQAAGEATSIHGTVAHFLSPRRSRRKPKTR